jgi:hypothetical protein
MFLIVGGLVVTGLFTLAGMLYNHNDKRLAIWTFFVAGVFTLFMICKVWADSVGTPLIEVSSTTPTPTPAITPTQTPTPTPMKKDDRPTQSITTTNQSGGQNIIAGGDVHLAPLPRTITAADRSKFISAVRDAPKGKVDIWFAAADPEANAFAERLVSLLNEAGYQAKVGGGFMAAISPPLVGVIICIADGTNPPPLANPLRYAFKQVDIDTSGMIDKGLSKDELRIRVGPIPPKDR